MAIITKTLGNFDNGNVVFELDYDNVNLRLTALRCINNTSQAAYGQARKTSNGRAYDMRFGPGTTVIAIPTQTATRLTITIDARGRVDGVDYQLMWPYP
jgi:hypothetical protein